MPTLKELLEQKATLDKQIEEAGRSERSAAISQVRALMADHGLTVADLGNAKPPSKSTSTKGAKVAAKYRNSETGDTWSGRGLQPNWLKSAIAAGKSLDDFAVSSS